MNSWTFVPIFGTWIPFWGSLEWRTTLVYGSLKAHGRLSVRVNWAFFAIYYGSGVMKRNVYSSAVFRWVNLFTLKFYLDRVVPLNHSWPKKASGTGLSGGEDRTPLRSLILTQCNVMCSFVTRKINSPQMCYGTCRSVGREFQTTAQKTAIPEFDGRTTDGQTDGRTDGRTDMP